MRLGRALGLAVVALVVANAATGCGGRSTRVLGSGPEPSGEGGTSGVGTTGGAGLVGGSGGASGAGGSAGNGAAAGTAGSGSECSEPPILLSPLAPAIEFLVDSSGSMREPWVGDTTRWEFVRDALVGAFSGLSGETAPGLVFYPNVQWSAGIEGQGDDFCLLTYEAAPIDELSDAHRLELVEAVEQQPTLGATPTYDAYEYATSLLSGAPRRAKVAVLLTDGAPTYADGCVGDGITPVDGVPLADAARNALASSGIRTFVIGLSGAVDVLSEMAFAGGTGRVDCQGSVDRACHFDASAWPNPDVFLEASLSTIEREASRCVFEAPSLDDYPASSRAVLFTLVSPTGEVTLLSQTPPGEPCDEGVVPFEELGLYVLCSETCSRFAENSELRAEIRLGCVDPPSPQPYD